jgi:hypothetical protein
MPFFSRKYYAAAAVAMAIFAILGSQVISKTISTLNQGLQRWAGIITSPHPNTHAYQVQVFSRDPLVLHIESFLSSDEIAHVLQIR